MEEPPLKRGTRATVRLIPYYDSYDGAAICIVLIKERFVASRHGTVSREGSAEVRIADEYWDPEQPETSSIKYPSDLCLRKPSTDVVIVGSAMAPYRASVRELDVMVRVGPMRRALRVFGQRAWYKKSMGAMALTRPEPFEAQPIQWESAWGGSDYETDPKHPLEEPRNPNGKGLVRDPGALENQMGPSVEDPENLIESHRSRPRPAGIGAIGRHWEPRRNYSGTFDEEWMQERMPLLPLDFDERFNQVAPPELIAPAPLRGGERVEILNMHDEGPVAFDLPKLRFFAGIQSAERMIEAPPQLDTVLVEPNERAVEMTWRAIVPMPRRACDVRFVQVHEKEFV